MSRSMSSTVALRGTIGTTGGSGSGSGRRVSRVEWIDGVVPLGVVTLSLIDTEGVEGLREGGAGVMGGCMHRSAGYTNNYTGALTDCDGVDGGGDDDGDEGGDVYRDGCSVGAGDGVTSRGV